MKRLSASKWVPSLNYISGERKYDSLITPLPMKTQGGLIKCSLFSSIIKVLRMARNLNDHVRLGKMILTQLVLSKIEFVWESYYVLIALLNRRNLQKRNCPVTVQSVVCTLDVAGDLAWSMQSMANQGWKSGNIWLVCTVLYWRISIGFILDQWNNATWQDRRPPRAPPEGWVGCLHS